MAHYDDDEARPVNRITAGAVGEPGRRAFVLQAQIGQDLISWVIEKEQAIGLGESIPELLAEIHAEFPELDAPVVAHEPNMTLREPLEPAFRVGSIGLGYDRLHDLVVLTLVDAAAFDLELSSYSSDEEMASIELSIYTTRGQALLLSQRAEEIVAAGRPFCPLCGAPIDDFGHFCMPPAARGRLGGEYVL